MTARVDPEGVRAIPTSLAWSALDSFPDEVALLDREGRIVYVNEAWTRYGEANGGPPEVLGTRYLDGVDPAGRDAETATAAVRNLERLLRGESRRFSLEYPCHSTVDRRWFLLTAVAFEFGEERFFVLVHHNTTERRLAMEAVERRQSDLEGFYASISHDLRGPLRRIESLASDLVERGPGNGEAEFILAEASRARKLTGAMLELARISAVRLQYETIDVTALVRELTESLRREDPDRNVVLTVEPGMQATGDAALLRALWGNVLRNAWKFAERRDVARIEAGRASTTGGRTTFFVRDNGVGFEAEEASRLFRPFERLGSAVNFAGTGIGLTTVARIVERHGGTVWAEGRPNEGATFWWTLPS